MRSSEGGCGFPIVSERQKIDRLLWVVDDAWSQKRVSLTRINRKTAISEKAVALAGACWPCGTRYRIGSSPRRRKSLKSNHNVGGPDGRS